MSIPLPTIHPPPLEFTLQRGFPPIPPSPPVLIIQPNQHHQQPSHAPPRATLLRSSRCRRCIDLHTPLHTPLHTYCLFCMFLHACFASCKTRLASICIPLNPLKKHPNSHHTHTKLTPNHPETPTNSTKTTQFASSLHHVCMFLHNFHHSDTTYSALFTSPP